ncbi:MAG: DNA polymerase Y family protein [Planctomycetes bacterium]|nr:DNA polymerase Y family protein [Planctomycetota bacterium]
MERWACVDVPALPLQLLLLREPDWRDAPAVVVDADKPQGVIEWANRSARQCQIRPGMRYATALSLDPGLRAGVVDELERVEASDRIVARLRAFSPEIEPSQTEPGVSWLDASGFEGLFDSLEVWGRGVVAALREIGYHASVAVGFTRFGSYALARQGRGCTVFASPEEERERSGRVPLDSLQIDGRLRTALDRLGIRDVAGLRRLPDGGLVERFGERGRELQEFVAGRANDLLVPVPEFEPVEDRLELDPGETPFDETSLLFVVKSRLGPLCRELAQRGEAVRVLHLRVLLDDADPADESVRPAEPTLDEVQLVDLLRLRIERCTWSAPPIGFELRLEGARAKREQLELFAERPRRDLAAANRALARLRAEFGESSVVCARLRDGHLPEACFAWHALARLEVARPVVRGRPVLVRRLLAKTRRLARDRHEPDGWCAAGLQCGPVRRTFGPYVVSGGWWRREVSRAYHFAETARGDVLWVYYDRYRRGWYQSGAVD